MSLMINQNITALNAWRNLNKTDREMSGVMEKLSSGLRINKAADDPAGLVISEQMRAQVVGLKAAIKNSEKGVSMIQTAEAALDKMHSLLDKMRGLALDSASSATSDENMLAANQAEIDNILETLTRISEMTQYGTKKLLNGDNANTAEVNSAGATGLADAAVVSSTLATGTFNLTITENTAGTTGLSDPDNTGVDFGASNTPIQAAATLSAGTHALAIAGTTYDAVGGTVAGGGNTGNGTLTSGGFYTGTIDTTYTFVSTSADNTDSGAGAVAFTWSDSQGNGGAISITGGVITGDTPGLNGVTFTIAGNDVDTGDTFTIAATASNMTASLDGASVTRLFTNSGADVQLTSGLTGGGSAYFDLSSSPTAGTLNLTVTAATYDAALANPAEGTIGTAITGFSAADGAQTFDDGSGGALTLDLRALAGAGTVQFANTNNSLIFQIGANQGQTVAIAIRDVAADQLALGVANESGFASLADIRIDTAQRATDAIGFIDEAINQISVIRGNLGAFQANTLEANLDSLRVAAENLQASESVIRDTDMAAEMAQFTKYQIMMQAGTAMLAQANQVPQNLLRLLQG